MPLATRPDLEAVIGVDALDELLGVAVPADASVEQAQAAEQARLDAALRAGDHLISQFLPVPDPDAAPGVLREFAVEEALYYLLKHTKAGAPEGYRDAADQRRRDLAMMRKREQMPGSPTGQASHRPRVVPSEGRYTTGVKRRYY